MITVLLVHGWYTDTTSWTPAAAQLEQAGVPVRAVATPLRGLRHDSGFVARWMGEVAGPVLPVGHAYGGAVITVASAPHAVGLVYVSGLALDVGETARRFAGRDHRAADLAQDLPAGRASGTGRWPSPVWTNRRRVPHGACCLRGT